MSADLPPPDVLAAFGLAGPARPLQGGQGSSVRAGDAVLKPAGDPAEAEWTARLLASLPASSEFRVPRPLRVSSGRHVIAGWTATRFVAGVPGPDGRWADLLAAGRAFHRALGPVPRPVFLDRRDHAWARADRIAWGAPSGPVPPDIEPLLARLVAQRRPVDLPAQLVHGDLTGNVLFADGAPPAIIDFSPYWRPTGYADAIVAVDGMLYHDADLLALADRQLLVRALLFRLVTLAELTGPADSPHPAELARFARLTTRLELTPTPHPPTDPRPGVRRVRDE